ncbi:MULTISPECIES: inorganic phosphate transporter [unclassified Cytobacillus]|uniref:inorganic phosphate transporter n=1 Tax=unclassified Cytobacillus TaxID=2675268 RepID=UPI0013573521|nr:inorganic phosphate transporter [Cytobacillus sp. AMY 15.2]KAF0817811.1 Sulfate permease, Pit-type [Bacillus sp. ZZV12-4809]MCM3089907.1 anion permease [Cytobacillus sp. AMY 15.2]
MLTIIAVTVGLFFAMNIGASGAAASMGIAYGSGVLKNRMIALMLCGMAVFFGAWLGGGEVVKTMGSGIVPKETFTVAIALIVIASAALSLFLANVFGIPLSTSEVTVGSVVGAGIVYQSVFAGKLVWIVMFWLITPFAAFLIAIAAAALLKRNFVQKLIKKPKAAPILALLVVFMGVFEAFSAGMNNVANAVGPLVGAGIMSTGSGIFWGGLFVALGAVLLGKKVLETNGKKITKIRLEEGCVISGTGAGIVTIASVFGIPVPLTQITTSSIIGIGFVKQGRSVFKKDIVVQLLVVWVVSPVLSMVLSYTLIQLLIEHNVYPVIAMAGVLISVFGVKFLMNQAPANVSPITEKK